MMELELGPPKLWPCLYGVRWVCVVGWKRAAPFSIHRSDLYEMLQVLRDFLPYRRKELAIAAPLAVKFDSPQKIGVQNLALELLFVVQLDDIRSELVKSVRFLRFFSTAG